MLFHWENNTFRKITIWRKTRFSYRFYHHFWYHFHSNLASFFDTFSVSISGPHFWRHFSIFGVVIDAQRGPLATFGAPFSCPRGSKCRVPRSPGRHLEPFGARFVAVARCTCDVARATSHVQRATSHFRCIFLILYRF